MRIKIIIMGLISLAVIGSQLWAKNKKVKVSLNKGEKKAWHMQMVEMDIAIRNISSHISLGFAGSAAINFNGLTKYHVREFPDQRKAFDSGWGKFEKAKMAIHLREIRDEANEARKYLGSRLKKKRSVNWKKVEKSLNTILQNCRACHESVHLK